MSDSLGTTILETAVDLSGLVKGLDDAEDKAAGSSNRMGDSLKGAFSIAQGAAVAGAVAGVAVLGAALFDASEQANAIKQALGDLSDTEVQDVADAAGLLSARYGVELPETLAAVKTLMSEFGISSQQALDFVTKGFESGLNSSDDFLDTIGEYSNQFAQGGADAGFFFSTLETGLAGGALGTDKAADAFKEFQIRLLDGSESTAEALQKIGLGDLMDQVRSGAVDAADAMPLVQQALATIQDPVAQAEAAVALFGTQWEDLGAEAVLAIDTTKTGLEDLNGATDTAAGRIGSLQEVGPRVWQMISSAMIPVVEQLLPLIEEHLPTFQRLIEVIMAVAVPVLTLALNLLSVALTGLDAILSGNLSPALRGLEFLLRFSLGGAFEWLGGVAGRVGNWINEQWDRIANGAREKINDLVIWLNGIPQRLMDAGRNWIQGLADGVRDAWNNFWENTRQRVQDWINDFNGWLGNRSPSTKARGAMTNFWKGAELGSVAYEPVLAERGRTMADALMGPLMNLDQSRTQANYFNMSVNTGAMAPTVAADFNTMRAGVGGEA